MADEFGIPEDQKYKQYFIFFQVTYKTYWGFKNKTAYKGIYYLGGDNETWGEIVAQEVEHVYYMYGYAGGSISNPQHTQTLG